MRTLNRHHQATIAATIIALFLMPAVSSAQTTSAFPEGQGPAGITSFTKPNAKNAETADSAVSSGTAIYADNAGTLGGKAAIDLHVGAADTATAASKADSLLGYDGTTYNTAGSLRVGAADTATAASKADSLLGYDGTTYNTASSLRVGASDTAGMADSAGTATVADKANSLASDSIIDASMIKGTVASAKNAETATTATTATNADKLLQSGFYVSGSALTVLSAGTADEAAHSSTTGATCGALTHGTIYYDGPTLYQCLNGSLLKIQ